MTRFRLLFAFSILAVLATALVACGGGGGGGGGEDPQKVLDQTFSSNNESVKSGDLSLKFNADVTGSQGGTLNAELSGPFENQGSNQVPKLDFKVKADLSGSKQNFNFDGGLISTGDSAFVNYKGTDYQVDQTLFDQLKQTVQTSSAQQGQNKQSAGAVLKQLGISNPKDLLTNLKNDGTADVEGTSTNHISGDLDINKTVDALKSALSSASALGALGGASTQLPSASQLDQVKSAIKTAHFDLYSGQDDHILRRLTINLSIEPPSGSTKKVDLTFDLTLGKVNEPQTITPPSGAKPFSALLQQLGINPSALGALGALNGIGGGTSGGGGGSVPALPTPPSGTSGASAAQAQKYLNCISKANSAADLQACSALAP
ncbi:MAG: hypothetical protein AABM43_01725 [Actinomycetota bacterium]